MTSTRNKSIKSESKPLERYNEVEKITKNATKKGLQLNHLNNPHLNAITFQNM